MLAAEPLDVLYEALGEVMCAQEEDMCYKTYLLVSLIMLALDLKDSYIPHNKTYNKKVSNLSQQEMLLV